MSPPGGFLIIRAVIKPAGLATADSLHYSAPPGLGRALRVLAGATGFATRVDLDVEWPVSVREAYRAWQPKEPSPIVRKLLEQRKAGP